ncbi:UNVERIFIED_CONTAM: hypothetical protein GTU68_026475, partial [Idotea baltica]|nr:hypothetical protein [Idotea baltica]
MVNDIEWWKKAVVYQIYVKSFFDSNGDGIGDLQGVISKIPYLRELGVDVLWLNPIYLSPLDDNGYDISDYYNVHPDYGILEDLKELILLVHKNGMRLIMDLVINHTSDEHKWFVESKKSKDNPYRDYYIWKRGTLDSSGKEITPNNWGSFFEGSAWELSENTKEYYLHLFSRKQPDLNWSNNNVKEEIFCMIKWWLDQGIDGFRMDVINILKKPEDFKNSILNISKNDDTILDIDLYANNTGMEELLRELRGEVFDKYNTFTVGEMLGIDPSEAINYVNTKNGSLNMLIHFDL